MHAQQLYHCLQVRTSYKTGVEMEALTGRGSTCCAKYITVIHCLGASVAALTVYDMCKVSLIHAFDLCVLMCSSLQAMSHDIVIKETKLITKTGGKSDIGTNK